jgi:hypothetical protein
MQSLQKNILFAVTMMILIVSICAIKAQHDKGGA